MTGSFKLYQGESEYIRVLQRYIGACIAEMESKSLISASLDHMLANVNHHSDAERHGVAQVNPLFCVVARILCHKQLVNLFLLLITCTTH